MKFKSKYFIIIIFLLSFAFNYEKATIIINNIDYLEENDIVNDYYDNSDSYDDYDYFNNSYEENDNYTSSLDEVVNGYHVILEDDASLLTPVEENKLFERMKKITKYGNVIFKTINYNSSYTTAAYARQYYHNRFGNGANGTLFLIDMQNRIIHIFSDGSVYNVITSSKAEVITDNVYRYATRGEYFECADEAFDEIYSLLSGSKISEPMKYISNAILSIVIAALLGFIFSIKKASLKEPKLKDVVKHLNKKILVVGDFTFQNTGQRRVYSPPSDSSSGGSSSGGGGGSSGGGGGHSF